MSKSSLLYKKLLPSGSLDKSSLVQGDYDKLVQYIKTSFPKATSMQRDIELSLKRTFVFGSATGSKANKSFRVQRPSTNRIRRRNRKGSRITPIPKRLPFAKFQDLNNLWKSYIADLTGNTHKQEDIQLKLNKADFHGANIVVTHSNCKDFIGLQGIVIKETKNIFVIVSSENLTKTIPKRESEFQITIGEPCGTMVIAGNSFLTRPAERASKKIKSFMEFMGSKAYKSTLRYTRT